MLSRLLKIQLIMVCLLVLLCPAPATAGGVADLEKITDKLQQHEALKKLCQEMYLSKEYGEAMDLFALYLESTFTDLDVEQTFCKIAMDLSNQKDFTSLVKIAEGLKSQCYRDYVYTTVFIPVCILQKQPLNARSAINLLENEKCKELAESALQNNDPSRINTQIPNLKIDAEDAFFAQYGSRTYNSDPAAKPAPKPDRQPRASAPKPAPKPSGPAAAEKEALQKAFQAIKKYNLGQAMDTVQNSPDYCKVKVYATIIAFLHSKENVLAAELRERCLALCVDISPEQARPVALTETAEAYRATGDTETARMMFRKALDAVKKQATETRDPRFMQEFKIVLESAGETELATALTALGGDAAAKSATGGDSWFVPGIFSSLFQKE